MDYYKDLIEILREMSKFFVHNEASSMRVPDEMVTSMNAEVVKDAADAIEHLLAENAKLKAERGAVPVVRCKDCKYRDPEDKKCDCGGLERQGVPFAVADDYYCAFGERRSDK